MSYKQLASILIKEKIVIFLTLRKIQTVFVKYLNLSEIYIYILNGFVSVRFICNRTREQRNLFYLKKKRMKRRKNSFRKVFFLSIYVLSPIGD